METGHKPNCIPFNGNEFTAAAKFTKLKCKVKGRATWVSLAT